MEWWERGFDVAEIDQHTPIIQFFTFQDNHCSTVVSVQFFALSIVIEQSMAIAKIDLLGHAVHKSNPEAIETDELADIELYRKLREDRETGAPITNREIKSVP